MTTVHLALLLALAAPGTPTRNARPSQPETSADTAAAQPSTLSDAEVTAKVRTYLGAIDTPISAAQWKALGPRAVPTLESIARDPDALPSRRAKAVDALSSIGGARAKAAVTDLARADDAPFGVRASAIRGSPRVLSQRELSAQLRPVLEKASEPAVRATAAEVLAHHGGTGACDAVRAQVDRESGHDRASFGRALARCPSAR